MSRSGKQGKRHSNYYVVLGVPRDADPDAIRRAFQELAKRLHPDRAGADSTSAFQEVSEAYGVLSDPAARRRYDAQLERAARRKAQLRRGRPVRPMSVEPLEQRGPTRRSALGSWAAPPPSVSRGWQPVGARPPAEPAAELTVLLDSRQAAAGGRVVLEMPTLGRCSLCDGRGGRWPFPCLRCGGSGLVRGRGRWVADLPAGLDDGTVIQLRDPEGRPVLLRVHLRPGR